MCRPRQTISRRAAVRAPVVRPAHPKSVFFVSYVFGRHGRCGGEESFGFRGKGDWLLVRGRGRKRKEDRKGSALLARPAIRKTRGVPRARPLVKFSELQTERDSGETRQSLIARPVRRSTSDAPRGGRHFFLRFSEILRPARTSSSFSRADRGLFARESNPIVFSAFTPRDAIAREISLALLRARAPIPVRYRNGRT